MKWPVRKHVHGLAYAKADDRVRFEVSYAKPPSKATQPRPTGIRGFVPLLMHLIADAARPMRLAFEAIHQRASGAEASFACFLALSRAVIDVTAGDPVLHDRVWTDLMWGEGITSDPSGGVAPSIVAELQQRGIVKRYRTRLRDRSGLPRFALTPEYAEVVRRQFAWAREAAG